MQLVGVPMGDELPAGRYAAMRKLDTRTKTATLYGYGVPDGASVPDVESVPCRIEQAGGRSSPRLKLDDGSVVFAAECYLMPEDVFNDLVKARGLTVVQSSIEEGRASAFEKLKKDPLSNGLYLATLDVERIVKARMDIEAEIAKRDNAGVPPEAKVAPENLIEGPSTLQ